MWRILITEILTALSIATFTGVSVGSADDGPGVPVSQYVSRNSDEASIIQLIRMVGEGWARKDVDHIMSAYAPDATQRAWNDPNLMINYEGIRNEALGAFQDPKIGRVQFDDWIHRIYIVNSSAVVEINQKFHGWGNDHYYRDFWMFARRQGRWQLVRYDYEPQPPFLER